ncbi:hypothetical protein BJX65DRAFT_277437 [Aspergillus insuetus]
MNVPREMYDVGLAQPASRTTSVQLTVFPHTMVVLVFAQEGMVPCLRHGSRQFPYPMMKRTAYYPNVMAHICEFPGARGQQRIRYAIKNGAMSCDLSDSATWFRDLEDWAKVGSLARNVYLNARRLHVKDLEQRIIGFSVGCELSGLFDDDWLWCRDSALPRTRIFSRVSVIVRGGVQTVGVAENVLSRCTGRVLGFSKIGSRTRLFPHS